MSTNNGGYNVQTVKNPPQHLKCPLCTWILKDTLQTDRGNRACKECFTNSSKQLPKGVCPIDGESNTITFKDRYADKEVLHLQVYCQNKKYGCDWVGYLKGLDIHIQEECKFVQKTITSEGQSIQCPFKCGTNLDPTDLDKHLSNCARATSQDCCLFEALGCVHDGSEPLEMHMTTNGIQHAKLITATFVKSDSTCKQLQAEVEQLKDQVEKLKQLVETETIKNITLKFEYKSMFDDFLNGVKEKDERRDEEIKKMQQIIEDQKQKNENLEKSLKELEGKNVADKKQQSMSVAKDIGKAASAKDVAEVSKKVALIESNCSSIRTSVSELDLRQQLLENTCFDGKFVWKIDKLDHRMKQAQDGAVTALHSAPCFTKRFGYKFCARLYLNGDGTGKGKCVSLFFVMMRSEYDELLEWPFKEKVSFKLIHPFNDFESVKESFTPDGRSPSFKRPTREMNVAAGCPTFVSQKKLLDSFVSDNSIYIETIVGNN